MTGTHFHKNWKSQVAWMHRLATHLEKVGLTLRGDAKTEIVKIRLYVLARIAEIETPHRDYD